MLRVATRYTDWWSISWTGIDMYRMPVEEFERACTEVQRDRQQRATPGMAAVSVGRPKLP